MMIPSMHTLYLSIYAWEFDDDNNVRDVQESARAVCMQYMLYSESEIKIQEVKRTCRYSDERRNAARLGDGSAARLGDDSAARLGDDPV